MKNAKNAHFWQKDHKIERILSSPEVEILPSEKAWEKYKFVKKYFKEKPKEGYFIWIKKKVDFPLISCVSVCQKKISQNLKNVLVLERGIEAKLKSFCFVAKKYLFSSHKAKGKIILREKSLLFYEHFHSFGKKDLVLVDYEFFLEKDAYLFYLYKNFSPPEKLLIKNTIFCQRNSISSLKKIIDAKNSKIGILDKVELLGKDSKSKVEFRLIGREKSQIEAISQIRAKAASRGHLDCQGLLIDKESKISLTPRLICQNKEATLTHEASIGKIAQEQLMYLRTRGLTEKEAINLIVSGFLKS